MEPHLYPTAKYDMIVRRISRAVSSKDLGRIQMKLNALISVAALSIVASFGCTVGAYAQSDCKTFVKA